MPLDSSYYAFFLENTIPYQYQAVYHTPSGTPWSNPIQLTAAGTLPVNVFFDPNLVYRIEIRAGNSQADALIWLIEDYTPDGGGDGPITTASITSDNQMTNPQFSLISFDSPLTVTSAGAVNIAPGWDLVLAGTGTATVTQTPLNNTNANPTNAPYALQFGLSGWDSAYLRQRFDQNGMLWAGKYVSTSVTARVEGANSNISATMVDSNGTLLGTLLPVTTLVDSNYNELRGVALLPATTNPDVPPAAWVEYRLNFLGAMSIFVTSFQVLSSGSDVAFSYEQETIQRQIDHTYNTAYPIVPVGAIIDYSGFSIPEHYLNCNGDAYNRVTYSQLFDVLTVVETVTLTNTVATFTVVSSADYWVGMALEGDGVPASTTISAISGTTITMSNAATLTGASDVRFFAAGAGDGSTTFNVPNLEDYVIAGVGGSLFGADGNGVGAQGGSATHLLDANELPAHTHATNLQPASGVGAASRLDQGGGAQQTGNNATAHNPFTIVQQTALLRKIIRYE